MSRGKAFRRGYSTIKPDDLYLWFYKDNENRIDFGWLDYEQSRDVDYNSSCTHQTFRRIDDAEKEAQKLADNLGMNVTVSYIVRSKKFEKGMGMSEWIQKPSQKREENK